MPTTDMPLRSGARGRLGRGGALLAALLLLALAPGVPVLARQWATVDYYAHGYVIAPIALWLALAKRRALAALPAAPDARGRAALAAFLALYGVGFLAGVPMLVGAGMIGSVAAAVLALAGSAWLRALAFPLAYLLFLVPLPLGWIAPIVSALQLLSSEIATTLAGALGLPVTREGNVIVLPSGRLFVAEACSGISSVVTLLPAAVLLGHLRRSRRVAIALVAAAVPIAVLWNVVRVEATIVASLHFGVERATASDLHRLAGVLSYLLGCLSLLAVDALALRGPGRGRRTSAGSGA